MTPDATPSLRRRVVASAGRVVGAPERAQLVRLLERADGYRLDGGAAAALATTLARTPQSVERNLDLIRFSADGTWVEYPDAPRRPEGVEPLPGARHPSDVGMLVCPDPGDDDKVMMVSAWDFEVPGADEGLASVRHSYAAVAFSREEVSRHAYEARRGRTGDAGGALERILSLMHPYIPTGLGDELALMSDARDADGLRAAEDSAMRDVTSEAPFALAAMMLLSVGPSPSWEGVDGVAPVPLAPRRPLSGLRAALLGHGFVRRGRPSSPRLSYLPPAA